MNREEKINNLYALFQEGCKELSSRTKSEIIPAFNYDSGGLGFTTLNLFNKENWNDQVILKLRNHICNMVYNDIGNIKDYYVNDENVMVFNTDNNVYAVTWYKDRGRTYSIINLIEFRVINLNELIEIYDYFNLWVVMDK